MSRSTSRATGAAGRASRALGQASDASNKPLIPPKFLLEKNDSGNSHQTTRANGAGLVPRLLREAKVAMRTTEHVITLLAEVLQRSDRVSVFDDSASLLGALPELDSMAVATVIGALEERFEIIVEEEEVSAEIFATAGSLAAFVDQKITA